MVNADGTLDFGPVKASRNYKIGESIEMHSEYVSGCLVLSISAHEESDKSDIQTIILSAKEYTLFKNYCEEIRTEIIPAFAFDQSRPDSGISVHSLASDLKVEISCMENTEKVKEFVVRLIRDDPDPDSSNVVAFDKDEFQQLDKAMKMFWFVFDKYPRNIQSFPGAGGDLARRMLDRFSLEMIRLITEKYSDADEFDGDAFDDPIYRSAFFTSYAEMLNLSYINSILAELEQEFKTDLDMYTLAHQVMNQLDLLCANMDMLAKSESDQSEEK